MELEQQHLEMEKRGKGKGMLLRKGPSLSIIRDGTLGCAGGGQVWGSEVVAVRYVATSA